MKKNEDEQRIFDSINTSGQPLANFDIVKNDLFSHFKNEKEAEKIYIEYWIPVFEKNEEIREFWDEEVLVGRDKKVRSDIFLHSFAILENIFDPSKDTLSKLKEIYKEHIEQKNEENILEFIKKFTEYAEVFKKLPFFHNEEEYAYTDTMKRFLHITHVLQLSTLVPLALYLELMFQQKKISEKNYVSSLQLLEKYIIRRSLSNLDTSSYNKTIYALIGELSKSSDIYTTLEKFLTTLKADSDRFPTLQEISTISFKGFDTKLAKLLLFWIELYNRHHTSEFTDAKETLQYNFQLEHIMPRSWGQYWILPEINNTINNFNEELKTSNKINKDLWDYDNFDLVTKLNELGYDGETINNARNKRNKKIHEIGNYTLLSGRLNNSLKNYEWQRKLNGEGGKKGVKGYSSLSLNRELIDKYAKEWTEDTITERTQTLKNYILKIW